MEMEASALRNFKDFLQLYNKTTEICFNRCIDNVNSRNLDQNEIDCVDDCSSKFVNFNNKLMQGFVTAQTQIMNNRVAEVEKQQQLENNSLEQTRLETNSNNSVTAVGRQNDLNNVLAENSKTELAIS